MFKITIALIVLFLLMQKPVTAQQVNKPLVQFGLKDFLKELYDVSTLPSYATGSYVAEVSTYDRTGGNNDGFNGTYSFVRRNADSSLVLFDIKGAGVINRIWTPTPSNDSLDFYIDDTLHPAFTICYKDLFSGKVFPFVAPLCANQLGGFYCYLPIPFNESCKIVFRGKTTRFHQIGYRLYPKGVYINKFKLPLNKEVVEELATLKSRWSNPNFPIKDSYKNGPPISTESKNLLLKPGQQITVFQTNQPGRILGFELLSSDNLATIAKDIDLKITWDDDKVPAVYCPLADYFGYAFGKPSMKSLLIGSDGEKNYSYFPMPFDKAAHVELLYRRPLDGSKEKTVNFKSNIYFTKQKRVVTTEGKFYANWHRENPVADGHPYTMLDVKGRGHFVGTALQAQGLNAGMTTFFEGDDSTVVDGELRMHGTGSEDFFNGGWYALLDCWDAAMSLPLSGALEYAVSLAHTGGYRFFIGDKVSFEKSFFHSIEHGPEGNHVPADYTSVSYYYCSNNNQQQLIPSATNTRLYQQDTLILYPQLLNVGTEGKVAIDTKWAFPTGGLSFYYTVEEETKLRVSLQDIPAGRYHVYIDYVNSPVGANFSIWQRQTPITEWIDTHNATVERNELKNMCDLEITPLNKTISFRFKTAGNRNQFILNRIVLIKK